MTQYAPFDAVDYLNSEAHCTEYLAAALEDPNPDVFISALSDVARARGMTHIDGRARYQTDHGNGLAYGILLLNRSILRYHVQRLIHQGNIGQIDRAVFQALKAAHPFGDRTQEPVFAVRQTHPLAAVAGEASTARSVRPRKKFPKLS